MASEPPPPGQGAAVTGSDRSIRIDVPCDLAAMGPARAEVLAAAAGWGYVGLTELEIVMSELLTNAIRHASSDATVQCSMDAAGGIDLSVTDSSSVLPARRDVDAVATSGRGLAIVDALSQSWGVTPTPADGKTVWAHLGG